MNVFQILDTEYIHEDFCYSFAAELNTSMGVLAERNRSHCKLWLASSLLFCPDKEIWNIHKVIVMLKEKRPSGYISDPVNPLQGLCGEDVVPANSNVERQGLIKGR